LALALLLVAIPLAKVARQRLAMARARSPRDRVLQAYVSLAERAGDLGFGRGAHETLWEYRCRLKSSLRSLDGHLDRITALATRAAYSDEDLVPTDAEQALEAARRAGAEIARSAGMARRLAARFRVEAPGASR
jgi:hypothetical protein